MSIIDVSTATRRKKKEGKVIKISHFLANYLRKRGSRGESFDSILRRHFGLPDRKGKPNKLAYYYVVPGEKPIIRTDLAEARGEAIVQAARKGLKKAVAVLTLREVP